MSDALKIDVWSDIACPWCYIGKRNLEGGIAAFKKEHPKTEIEVEYHSYELSPDTPVDFEGTPIDFLVKHKRMPEAQVREMIDRVVGVAAQAGLNYNYDILKQTKTVKAHELLHYAKAHGKQVEMKERLLRAHFVEGAHVGREEDLADLAAEVGLDREDVLRSLRESEYLEAVRADQQQAAAYGITGVPFFVLNDKYGVSGAQPVETFAEALSMVEQERAGAAS